MVTVLCNRIGGGVLVTIRIMIITGRWELIMLKGYLMIRFNRFLMETNVRTILDFFSIVTIFILGIMANFENDFKEIVALSTLSQLGLIIIILSFGFRLIAYYHLLIHAIFKSILFMAVGTVIHSMKNTQDIRLLGNLNEVIPYVIIIRLLILNIALRDVPFILVFYRKDIIIEIIYRKREVNIFTKPINSGRYLNYFSNHPLAHKRGVIIGQLDRILFLSHPKFHEKNISELIHMLLSNGYPLKFIFSTIKNRIKTLEN
ncbi:NU5M oxidoreductase, partial [Acromyrmex heyeri]